MRVRLPMLAALALATLLAGSTRADGPGEVQRTLDIHVDATSGTDLGFRLVASGLEVGRSFYVKQVVDPDQVGFTDPVFETEAGEPVAWELKNRRFTVAESPAETLVVRYRATPGGRARHGHQGLVTPEWAGFDGRSVLQPKEIAAYDAVRWHFTLPEGWTVASPMLRIDEDSWAMPPMAPRYRASVLKSVCMGLGPFAEHSRTRGSTEFRVFTLERWEDGAEIAGKAQEVLGFFHESLGFDPGVPFAVVWTPPGPKMAPVWSGSGAVSTCYERPQEGFHNWELLGHRVAHPMNEYPPFGFVIDRPEDHWFMEGWATYIERPALAAAGIADLGRLNALLERHHDELEEHPEWARTALADEPAARGAIVENLHYRRGALVSTMLAFHLEQRSGKTLEQFMRHVVRTHGGFKKGLDLRAELESFSGAPMDDFWAAMVDGTGPVVPVWEAYAQQLPAARPAPAIQAGALAWSGEQLFQMLASGDFEGAVDLADKLQQTGLKHAELERRGVALVPDRLAELRTAMPSRVRADLDALERLWPLEGGPPLPSGGCSGPAKALPVPSLVAADPEGELFLQLVEAERKAARRPAGREGVVSIRFGIDDSEPRRPLSVAAVPAEAKLRVIMQWVAPRPGMRLEIWDGEERVAKRWVEVQSDWSNTWMRFGPDRVETHTGILDVRLVVDGKVVGSRPVWRRASPVALPTD